MTNNFKIISSQSEDSLQIQIEESNVKADFENHINDYLEFKSKELKINQEHMCQYAVKHFEAPGLSATTIRRIVKPKFKQDHRIQNVKKRKRVKLSKSDLSKLAKIKKAFIDHANGIANPMYEGLTWIKNG